MHLSEKNYNIHTLKLENLISLLVKLNSYKLSVDDLGIKDFIISGYKIEEWLSDIKQKMDIFRIQQKKKELSILEKKLISLLSNDTKTELESNEIEDSLL